MSIGSQAPHDDPDPEYQRRLWCGAENMGEGGLLEADRGSLFALLLCKLGNICKQQILVQRPTAFLLPPSLAVSPTPLHVHMSSAISVRGPTLWLEWKGVVSFVVGHAQVGPELEAPSAPLSVPLFLFSSL